MGERDGLQRPALFGHWLSFGGYWQYLLCISVILRVAWVVDEPLASCMVMHFYVCVFKWQSVSLVKWKGVFNGFLVFIHVFVMHYPSSHIISPRMILIPKYHSHIRYFVLSWSLGSFLQRCSARMTWWRHQMETFSALLALCAGNSPVSGEFLSQRPVTRSFNVFFDLWSASEQTIE